LDGYGVALTVGLDGEVWLAAEGYRALFGFNPTVGTWDRTIPLPLIPTGATSLAVPTAGIVTINGIKTVGGPTPEPKAASQSRTGRSAGFGVLLLVNTTTNVFTVLPPHVFTYVPVDGNNVVYVDDTGAFFRLDLSSGQSTLLASKAPMNRFLPLAVDKAGNIWFSMVAFRSVGVGRLNQSSGAITTFPFPYIQDPGQKLSGSPSPLNLPCPAPFHCISSFDVFDPEVQAIVIDAGNNVWVIDRQPDTGAPGPSVVSPIYELRVGS
jgi:hypothetical protein